MDTPDSEPNAPAEPEGGERIAKRLARAGLCSRRDAERWIAEGRVAVNGSVLTGPACVVRPGDVVQVDGKVVPEPEPARLWRYHKPSGLVTTARDEKGRTTVFDRLPPDMPRVVSIGRLDLTTEGLLLLTNDGELARFLELPATGWTRRYRVRVFGEVDERKLADLEKGPTIDGVKYGPIEAVLDRIQGRNAWLTVSLKEGKNREIRRVMESLGLQVNRLIRVAYGPFQLGKLEEGAVEEVPKRVVREQVSRFFTGGDPVEEPVAKGGRGAKDAAAKPAAKARDAKAGWARAEEPKTPPGRRGPVNKAAGPKGAAPKPAGSKLVGSKPVGAGARTAAAKPGTLTLKGPRSGPHAGGKAAAPKSAGKPGNGGPPGTKPRGAGPGRSGAGGRDGGDRSGGRDGGGRGGGAARPERNRADRRR